MSSDRTADLSYLVHHISHPNFSFQQGFAFRKAVNQINRKRRADVGWGKLKTWKRTLQTINTPRTSQNPPKASLFTNKFQKKKNQFLQQTKIAGIFYTTALRRISIHRNTKSIQLHEIKTEPYQGLLPFVLKRKIFFFPKPDTGWKLRYCADFKLRPIQPPAANLTNSERRSICIPGFKQCRTAKNHPPSRRYIHCIALRCRNRSRDEQRSRTRNAKVGTPKEIEGGG